MVALLMVLVGYQLWRLRRNLKEGVLRLAARGAPGAAVRAGRGAARRARLRGVGAVPRQEHRELVRRARGPRARRRPQPRAQRARLPAEGDGEQGRPDGADAVRGRRRAALRDAPQPGRRAGGRLRGDAVLVDAAACSPSAASAARRRRPSRRRRRRCAARGCSRRTRRSSRRADGGLVLRVVTPVNTDDRLEPLKRAAGRRAGAEGARGRTPRRCRPAGATTRRSRSRGRR